MRLPKSSSSYEPGRTDVTVNAEIVDQILSASERKRSRPTSSTSGNPLHFKPDTGRTSSPSQRSSNHRGMGEQQQEQPRRSSVSTRARSSGIPPHTVGVSNLEGMTEEEIMQALYNDPELADVAENIKASRARNSKTSRKAPDFRDAYPSHIKQKMDKGIPIMQWLVVLVLFGAGLYQLRKVLSLPDKPSKSSGSVAKTSKSKGKKVLSKTSLKVPTERIKEKEATFADVVKDKSSITPSASLASKKAKKAAKQKKPSEKGSGKNGKSEDAFKVKASPNGTTASAREEVRCPANLVDRETIFARSDDETADIGWQSVSAKQPTKTDNVKKPEVIDAEKSANNESGEETQAPLNNDSGRSSAASSGPGDGDSTVEFQPPKNAVKKKNKKSKAGSGDKNGANGAIKSGTEGIQDDKALALQLQKEEERLANNGFQVEKSMSLEQDGGDEEWAEVSTKKKRKP